MASIRTGAKAPAFSLCNQNNKKIALKDLAGRWVGLYFYPKDDTPGCTKEACEFTDQLKDFERLDARVLGVSPDSPASHLKFIEKYDLGIDLLSDPDHKVLERYGAWGEKSMYGKKYEGVLRSTVLIDPKGVVAHRWEKVTPAGHAEAVKQKLAELRKA